MTVHLVHSLLRPHAPPPPSRPAECSYPKERTRIPTRPGGFSVQKLPVSSSLGWAWGHSRVPQAPTGILSEGP